MASHTLTGRFPESAAISVFPSSAVAGLGNRPASTPVATGTVSGGAVTFTGLTEDAQYIAFNDADATQKVSFIVDNIAAGADDTANIADSAVTTAKLADANVTNAKLATDAVTQAKVADNAIGIAEVKLVLKDVTVALGASTGTATVVAGSKIIGFYGVSNQDQYVNSIAISGTTLTVTLHANATAANVFKVTVLEP